ncbi:hypothetical protein [Streptomyces virginiae]|uniref:hypothetical protein n=1 Tax=Streptomyces virginiae TaxID=1961 RepID=UPI002DBBCD3D|nr:hypothetical protein [Streptomyces sp. CMAA1738]MEC4572442.1 hypothetical protein [Streptomyces sp. CMAA1738]
MILTPGPGDGSYPRTPAAVRIRPAAAGAAVVTVAAGLGLRAAAADGAARLVLGSTFNAPDLVWYAVGATVGGLLHVAMSRRRRTPAAGDTPHT